MCNIITVCMIVKNEQKIIEESLKSISKYDFDIVVVDTGSTDSTKQIAMKYTDKVYDYNWQNDFSKARNYSISKANTDYVLIIDADEIIKEIDYKKLINIIKNDNHKVYRILRNNQYTRNDRKYNFKERVNRLFNKFEFEYEGRIHEQIVSKSKMSYDTSNIPIVLEHFGYENDEIKRKDKLSRNINLLLQEIKENGEDPYILYQLGKSYYMKNDYDKSIKYFTKVMDYDLDIRLEYVQDMIESYGYSLINSKLYKKSLDILNLYDEFKSSCDFVFLCGLIYMNNGLFDNAIEQFNKTLEYRECKMEGTNSFLSNYNIGVIYECLRQNDKAYEYYEKCGNYSEAKDAIKRIKRK